MEEINDFDKAIASKRHKEILTVLKQIAQNMESKEDSAILSIGDDIKNSIKNLEENLKNDEFSLHLKKLSTAWAKVVDNLNNKTETKDWQFDVKRNQQGYIESVKATKL